MEPFQKSVNQIRFIRLGSEQKYRTHSNFNYLTGDSLDHQNGMMFTTYDRDNDESASNCAVSFKGAWWHRGCHFSNLNGQYGTDSTSGIIWFHWRGYVHSLVRVQMMVRRKIKHQY